MASAISIDGELFYESYVGGTNGDRYIEFLKHLTGKDNKNKIVIQGANLFSGKSCCIFNLNIRFNFIPSSA